MTCGRSRSRIWLLRSETSLPGATSSVRRDLPDLDAVECYGAARWSGNLTGHGARSVLGIEDEQRSALVALKSNPVASDEARRLRAARHDFLLQKGQPLIDVVDCASHHPLRACGASFGARRRRILFCCGR